MTKILYVVHPDSILEQSVDIRHVKPFLDKLSNAIKSFSGIVIVTKIPSYSYNKTAEGFAYAEKFMASIKGNPKVIVVDEKRAKGALGTEAMSKYIDDLFLKGELDKITLAGCFTCTYSTMCLDETYSALVREYGSDKVEIDQSLTMKAGPVTLPRDAALRVCLSYLKK